MSDSASKWECGACGRESTDFKRLCDPRRKRTPPERRACEDGFASWGFGEPPWGPPKVSDDFWKQIRVNLERTP